MLAVNNTHVLQLCLRVQLCLSAVVISNMKISIA